METSTVTIKQLTAGLAESARQERLRCVREVQRVVNHLPFADVHTTMSVPEVRAMLLTLREKMLA